MPEPDDMAGPDDEWGGPSKSALKRRMHALQQLGETLAGLSDKQLQQLPIDSERLLQVVREARGIRSHSARRRHLQLIGKLMRDVDPEPIEKALQAMDRGHRESTEAFHELEQLRDAMLAAGPSGVELAAARWPQADRQHLRQLITQHQRELQRGKPPAASRKLFRYLRELQEFQGTIEE
jgi:ribosome-associated protein